MKAAMPSMNRFAFAGVCLLTLYSAGCQQRQEELVYVPSQAVQDLPEDQQEQIRALLTRFYGTPDNPRLMVLDEEAVVDDDGDQVADSVHTIARGLNVPNGVAWQYGALYVAEIDRVVALLPGLVERVRRIAA